MIVAFIDECRQEGYAVESVCRHLTDIEWATAGWIDWYNSRRLHSSLDYSTPEGFESARYAALNRDLQPV